MIIKKIKYLKPPLSFQEQLAKLEERGLLIPNKKQALIYQAEDGSFQTEVRLESETIWLSQKQMS